MATTTQIIARQGYKGAIILFIGFALCLWAELDICAFVLFVGLVLWLFAFRNPEKIPANIAPNAFVSPVDGIVREICMIDSALHIVIETRALDVGIIRAPCDVLKADISYKHGLTLSLANKATKKALNATMSFKCVDDNAFELVFYPICFGSHSLFASENLHIGERIGFMKMGQTRIIIPQSTKKSKNAELELKISIGDKLSSLHSIIGYFH